MLEDHGSRQHAYEVIVVGGGPAGLSGALLLGRCARRVLVIDAGEPRNARGAGASALHGYLGRDGVRPEQLRSTGREELARYGIDVLRAKAVDAFRDGHGFGVVLDDGQRLHATKLLLATGVRDDLPDLPGLTARFGRSVLSCPYCHAWELRDRHLCVLGRGDEAASFAASLAHWSANVTLLTDGSPEPRGEARERLQRAGVLVVGDRVQALEGPGLDLEWIVLRGARVRCDALFLKMGCRPASDLAVRLGCLVEGPNVQAPANGRTNVPGVFVVGDATPQPKMAIIAAAEGAQAAMEIQCDLRDEALRRVPATPSARGGELDGRSSTDPVDEASIESFPASDAPAR